MPCIYALQSPGGWHLIGRTPAPLWDLQRDPPATLAAGDQVRFVPITLGDYEALARRSASGALRLQPEEHLAAAGAAA
jgi:allophanate hydrolase subunit 1